MLDTIASEGAWSEMEFRLEERWFVISDPGGEPWALIRQLPNSNIERYLPGRGVWVPRQEMADYLFGEPGARQVLPENWELAKKISTLVDGVDPDAEPSESLAPAPQSNLAPSSSTSAGARPQVGRSIRTRSRSVRWSRGRSPRTRADSARSTCVSSVGT